MGATPPAEVSIDRSLVSALLQEQHTDLVHLPLTEIGDPATDLSVSWMLLPSSERQTFFTAAREEFDRLDGHTLMRARGWALVLGLAHLADARDETAMSAVGRATIDRALSDDS